MARTNYVDVRSLQECKPAFDMLRRFMLSIHGKPVKMHFYSNQKENPWSVADTGFTNPLLFQTSRSHVDKHLYPSTKRVLTNMLVKDFLPKANLTLQEMVETKNGGQEFWIRVKEFKEVVFCVFQFRGGGFGVGVCPLNGDMGMLHTIKESTAAAEEKHRIKVLRDAALQKLSKEEQEVLGI